MLNDRAFDAIVVGSGAAGSWAAKELTEHGLSVLVLEAGPGLTSVPDGSPPPSRSRLATRLVHGIARQPIQMRCPAYDARTRRFFVDDRDNPYTTPADKPFNWFRGRQVGGRLRTWARVVMRMSDLEFKGAREGGGGVDWPLAYADLAPYYDKVESFLGVLGSADGIASVPDGIYRGRFEMTAEEIAFKDAVERAFPLRRVITARVAMHDGGPVPAALRAAQRTGRLVLRSDAVAGRIVVDPATGAAAGVELVDRTTRARHEVRSKVVVLCASTIESVRILLNSACPRHPGGIGNSSGRLGRGLMDHVLVGIGGPSPPSPDRGGDSHADDPDDSSGVTGFYIPQAWQTADGSRPPFRRGYAIQGGIGRGPNWYLMAHGEMLPRAENRVTVNPGRRDAWGIPAAHIEIDWSANEIAMIEHASRALRQVADAAGLTVRMPPSGRLLDMIAFHAFRRRLQAPSGAFFPGSAIHELGGASMGETPTGSVVDRWGACWDAPNLFVTDGACFPAGCSQNITLTIMALTARACGRIVSELSRFQGPEAPGS
jgi:choline dehydrogenase-like flavoprotein